MALLLCFTETNDDQIDWSNKALYLDQKFYERIFEQMQHVEVSSALRNLTSIGYGEEYVVKANDLCKLRSELVSLQENQSDVKPQIVRFIAAVEKAIAAEKELIVSGDMFPDLSKTRTEPYTGK